MRRRREERGAATLLVLTMATLLVLVACSLSAVTGLVVAHRHAQSAADLAALAGAAGLAGGRSACEEAAQVALRNGASIRTCSIQGTDVLVEVVVPGPHWWGRQPQLTGRARAGLSPPTGA